MFKIKVFLLKLCRAWFCKFLKFYPPPKENNHNHDHRPRKTNSKEQQQQQPPKENNQPTIASPKTSITRILRQYALVEGWKTKQCTHLIPFTAFTASRRFRKGKFLFPLSMKKMLNSPNSLSSAFTTSALTVRLCKMQT